MSTPEPASPPAAATAHPPHSPATRPAASIARRAWGRWRGIVRAMAHVLRRTGDEFDDATRSMIKVLPLLLVWLLLPAVLFVVLTAVRAIVVNDPAVDAFHLNAPQFTDTTGRALRLVVNAPRRSPLALDGEDTDGMPVSIVLLDETRPLPTPTADPAAPTTTPTAPGTGATAGAASTPSGAVYTLKLMPQTDNVTFTDAEGLPLYPQFNLTPAPDASTPLIVYLRPTRRDGSTIRVAASVEDANRQVLLAATDLTWETRVDTQWWALLKYLPAQCFNAGAVAGLVGGLVAFAVQQWKQSVEEENEQQKQRELIGERIEDLSHALAQNVSTAAREYTRLYDLTSGSDARWPELAPELHKTWEAYAPDELQALMILHLDTARSTEADSDQNVVEWGPIEGVITWGYQKLDQQWREILGDILQRYQKTSLLENENERRWRAILHPWPFVRPWDPPHFTEPVGVMRGVSAMVLDGGLNQSALEADQPGINPFSTAPAELDPRLLKCRVQLEPLSRDLLSPGPAFVVGGAGAGKTALALLAIYELVSRDRHFPVYLPGPLDVAGDADAALTALARATASTLLNYWAALPNAFSRQPVEVKACVIELLHRYTGSGQQLLLRLQQAGFSPVGAGEMLQQTITALGDTLTFDTELSATDLISLLADARPDQHQYTYVMLDVSSRALSHDVRVDANRLAPWLALMPRLARAGIFLKLFVPDTLSRHIVDEVPDARVLRIEWTARALADLLKRRLRQAGLDRPYELSQLRKFERGEPGISNPDSRLIALVLGGDRPTPQHLFELGNELLRRVGETPDQPYIKDEDLRAVLGESEI